eukprot:SAG22_NODE_490_length_9834_cov_7.723780_12_plen_297_part_00
MTWSLVRLWQPERPRALLDPQPFPHPHPRLWEWEEDQAGSGNWKAYTDACAATLEAAVKAKKGTATLQIKSEQYDIDLKGMKQTKKSTGFVRAMRRTTVSTAPSTPRSVKLHTLAPGSSYHTEVLGALAKSLDLSSDYDVVTIALLCDRSKLGMYLANKDSFVARLGAGNANERWLWHGTESMLVDSILANGFLRDYNTTAMYGRGTYMAAQAKYSLQHSYAKPDANGVQHLLFSRVLVGEPCVGSSGMSKPGQKPGQVVLHESMVDKLSNPSIFVLSAGSDNQAYAEFYVQVKRK